MLQFVERLKPTQIPSAKDVMKTSMHGSAPQVLPTVNYFNRNGSSPSKDLKYTGSPQ